jgi:hypothetical protein
MIDRDRFLSLIKKPDIFKNVCIALVVLVFRILALPLALH